MIRVVISDFGGVLTTPLQNSFLAYQELSGISTAALGVAMETVAENSGKHPLIELEKGLLSQQEFVEQMSDALTAHLGERTEFHSFQETFFEHLHPNEEMIECLRDIRRREYRLALLTNNVREWEPHWRAMLPIDELFELVVDSAFVGVRKPERRIYEITLERLRELPGLDDVSAEQCVLVDDMQINCEAARTFGFEAVRLEHTGQAIADLEALLS